MTTEGMSLIVKNTARLVAGFIAVFGIYIALTGHLSPGGGFAGGVILAAAAVLVILAFGLLATPYGVISLVIIALPGLYLFLEGHQLRRQQLENGGFKMIGLIDATDEVSAIGRFLDKWSASPALPDRVAPPPARLNRPLQPTSSQPETGIGLFSTRE